MFFKLSRQLQIGVALIAIIGVGIAAVIVSSASATPAKHNSARPAIVTAKQSPAPATTTISPKITHSTITERNRSSHLSVSSPVATSTLPQQPPASSKSSVASLPQAASTVQCQPAQLAITMADQGTWAAKPSHFLYRVRLTNKSTSVCSLDGYPQFSTVVQTSPPLNVPYGVGHWDNMAKLWGEPVIPENDVTLQPGQAADFVVTGIAYDGRISTPAYVDSCGGNNSLCSYATTMKLAGWSSDLKMPQPLNLPESRVVDVGIVIETPLFPSTSYPGLLRGELKKAEDAYAAEQAKS